MPDAERGSNYSLALSEAERRRYRSMAAAAAEQEADDWAAAGISAGARVADVGCGPGAVLRVIAERVGGSGTAIGVDGDSNAVALAREETADLPQASAEVGRADASDLPEGSFDAVMCRHVLAHKGGREQATID
ncbi:MAG: class I SAM-dependent methyltransferase, partial [Acidimicrobiales bacterium]